MHSYLKFTRNCGLCPCTSSGLSRRWLMYSVILLVIVIPCPVLLSVGMFWSGAVDIQYLPLHMNNLSLPLILAAHFWQLCFNENARPVMALLVKHRPRHINWLLSATLAICWIITQRVVASDASFVAHLFFIFPTEMLAPVILLQFCLCTEEITILMSCLLNYNGDFKTLMEIELGLIQQAKLVANFYAPQLTVACVNKFFHAALNAILLYDAFRVKETWVQISWRTALSILTMIDLGLVIWNIHNLQKMVQKCKARMFGLVMKYEELPSKMYVWSYLMTNENVRFTACGLFPISNSFVTSLVAASLSFLLMLNSLTTPISKAVPTIQQLTGGTLTAFTNPEGLITYTNTSPSDYSTQIN